MKKTQRLTAILLALIMCLALAACGGDKISEEDFVGCWQYVNFDTCIIIYDDGTWAMIDLGDAEPRKTGIAVFDDGEMTLFNEDGDADYILSMLDSDNIVDNDGDALYRAELSDEGEGAGSEASLDSFCGIWKYDDYEQVIVIYDDGTWDMYGTDGIYAGSASYEFDGESVTILNGAGNPATTLFPGDGQLVDADGDTLSPYEMALDQGPVLPTPSDPLSESIELPGFGLTVFYPETMTAGQQFDTSNALSFNALNEEGTDDIYSNIMIWMMPISGYDEYMNRGSDTAKKHMSELLNYAVTKTEGDRLLKTIGTDFVDGGSYWSMTAYNWLDSSGYTAAPEGSPVRGTLEVRYYGATGYAMVIRVRSIEPRIQNYFDIASNMLANMEYNTGFSTTPKAVPQTGGSGGAWSDSSDYGSTYYWNDADGDVWYWNGYEDVFIGYGDDYYIDGGQYYESNDSGWDYDDYDYYDDYDPWSDPGDGADAWSDPGDWDFDPWSDAGDTDYYESNDAGW